MQSNVDKTSAKILCSGAEFFQDLERAIANAKKFILIKQFLWRNDETGRIIAKALLLAMDRGVKVIIHKDRIGAFYEYGERTGQSFFHDNPRGDGFFGVHSLKTIYLQSQLFISKFYGEEVSPQVVNPLRSDLIHHRNCEVFDNYKLYDHSKVIVIDGKIVYLGGMGFGDEFMGNQKEKTWRDFMLKIVDRGECLKLLRLLSGEMVEESSSLFCFLNDSVLLNSRDSLHDFVLRFIAKTKRELFIDVPFLGHPDYINQITDVVLKGIRVNVILPAKANSHHYRNLHFLKRLMRQVGHSEFLQVRLSLVMSHGKIIISDECMLFGSHNLHMDRSVLEETIVKVSDKILVDKMREKIIENAVVCKNFDDSVGWWEIIIPSRAEYVSIKLQTFMKRIREKEIRKCRRICSLSLYSMQNTTLTSKT